MIALIPDAITLRRSQRTFRLVLNPGREGFGLCCASPEKGWSTVTFLQIRKISTRPCSGSRGNHPAPLLQQEKISSQDQTSDFSLVQYRELAQASLLLLQLIPMTKKRHGIKTLAFIASEAFKETCLILVAKAGKSLVTKINFKLVLSF